MFLPHAFKLRLLVAYITGYFFNLRLSVFIIGKQTFLKSLFLFFLKGEFAIYESLGAEDS